MKKFVITYIRTLVLQEMFEAATQEEAEQHAEERAWESCELLNRDFDTSETDFEVEKAEEALVQMPRILVTSV